MKREKKRQVVILYNHYTLSIEDAAGYRKHFHPFGAPASPFSRRKQGKIVRLAEGANLRESPARCFRNTLVGPGPEKRALFGR